MPARTEKNEEIPGELSRRKRQILDVIYVLGRADVQAVLGQLPDPPSYSAVRATLNTMVEEGVLTSAKDGRKFVYLPAHSRASAATEAIKRLLSTFFDGSVARAMEGMLDMADSQLPPEELAKLSRLIQDAKKKESK